MQRICDDVPAFTKATVGLCNGIVRKLFIVTAFAGVAQPDLPTLLASKPLMQTISIMHNIQYVTRHGRLESIGR